MTGVELIAAERQRQITEEGYDAAHDADLSDALARAGAVYAVPHNAAVQAKARAFDLLWPASWPFKPTPNDRIRELVKAGALIAAAIDSHINERHAA